MDGIVPLKTGDVLGCKDRSLRFGAVLSLLRGHLVREQLFPKSLVVRSRGRNVRTLSS
jgi:hypothetical protein